MFIQIQACHFIQRSLVTGVKTYLSKPLFPGYIFARRQHALSKPVTRPEPAGRNPDTDDWCYIPSWKRAMRETVTAARREGAQVAPSVIRHGLRAGKRTGRAVEPGGLRRGFGLCG
jgi:hypothetical protein